MVARRETVSRFSAEPKRKATAPTSNWPSAVLGASTQLQQLSYNSSREPEPSRLQRMNRGIYLAPSPHPHLTAARQGDVNLCLQARTVDDVDW